MCVKGYTDSEVEQILAYLQQLHPQPETCFVRMFSRASGKQYMYDVQHIQTRAGIERALSYFGIEDVMISLNTFKTRVHATNESLFSINALALDVDFRKTPRWEHASPKSVFWFIEQDYIRTGKIPSPSMIEYGNQLRLIYILEEPAYIPKQSKSVKVLSHRLMSEFAKVLRRDFHTDAQPLESFVRIPGGINTKTGCKVALNHYDGYRYTLNELQSEWLDEIPVWYDDWIGKKDVAKKDEIAGSGSVKKMTPLKLNKNRLSDFESIQQYLNAMGTVDLRRRLCFLYLNYSMLIYRYQPGATDESAYQKALSDTYAFNTNFLVPLPEKTVRSQNGATKKKQWLYSNAKIYEFLDLSLDLGAELNLKSLYEKKSRAQTNKDYYNRNAIALLDASAVRASMPENKERRKRQYQEAKAERQRYAREQYRSKLETVGKLSKAEQLEQRLADVSKLLESGLTQKEISNRLNVSISTIKRCVAQLRKRQ